MQIADYRTKMWNSLRKEEIWERLGEMGEL